MCCFPCGKSPVPHKTLSGRTFTIDESLAKGKQEISISSLQSDPIGFRVLEETGAQVYVWTLGDK
jgi:hypothetical protein